MSVSALLQAFLHRMRLRRWKRRFRVGRVVTEFIAKDVRRDVLVIDTSRIEEGVITGRIRTWNVLYALQGMVPKPPFGNVRTVEIRRISEWSGESWGGPVTDVPDGLS